MKRFTESAKWNDPWFRRLSPTNKTTMVPRYFFDDVNAPDKLTLAIASPLMIQARLTSYTLPVRVAHAA